MMEIKLIEYSKTKKGWLPHSVIKDNSIFDFDYCPSYDMLCYHMSGAGGLESASLGKYVCAPKIGSKIWIADGFKAFHNKSEITTRSQFRALGYQRIDTPIEINGTTDPFEYADADEPTEYCNFCGRVPSDQVCSHLFYDDYHGGFFLGCGSTDLDFERTRKSLFRLFRFLDETHLKKPLPRIASCFNSREFECDYRTQNHYEAGIAWLNSLDGKTKGPNALTTGWIYQYLERHSNRIASPESTLWIELPASKLSTFLDLDVNEEVVEKLTVKFPRKVSSAHDKFFNTTPKEITEVLLKPKTKQWRAEKVMNIAVRNVEVKRGKAEISFSYFITKGNKTCTRFRHG